MGMKGQSSCCTGWSNFVEMFTLVNWHLGFLFFMKLNEPTAKKESHSWHFPVTKQINKSVVVLPVNSSISAFTSMHPFIYSAVILLHHQSLVRVKHKTPFFITLKVSYSDCWWRKMGVRRNKKGQTGNKRDTWGVTLKNRDRHVNMF